MKRSVTISLKAMRAEQRRARRLGELVDAGELLEQRPRTRAECCDGPRPCPFVSCRYNLYLDVKASGSLQLNQPGQELEQFEHSCALDVAEAGPITLEEVGKLLGVTRERVRQIEEAAVARLQQPLEVAA